MRRIGWLGFAAIAFGALIWLAGDHMNAIAEEEVEYGYLGAASCKACHQSPKKGAQYKMWLESPHAKAYETLLNDHSKKICKDMGITTAPEETDQCLKCHVTGHGVKAELLDKKYDKTEGVSCESCHGPASAYKTTHIKDVEKAMTQGMRNPSDPEMCKACHNEESPTYKPFKYEEMLAEIAHPNPSKEEE
jgi:cytochrome c peroxidase